MDTYLCGNKRETHARQTIRRTVTTKSKETTLWIEKNSVFGCSGKFGGGTGIPGGLGANGWKQSQFNYKQTKIRTKVGFRVRQCAMAAPRTGGSAPSHVIAPRPGIFLSQTLLVTKQKQIGDRKLGHHGPDF